MAEKRARLLKAHVQATFVIDDGDSLTEWTGPVVECPAQEWPNFAAKSFQGDDLAAVLQQYEASQPKPEPKPNRAQRRSRAKKPPRTGGVTP